MKHQIPVMLQHGGAASFVIGHAMVVDGGQTTGL
jgi:hypothetical protein